MGKAGVYGNADNGGITEFGPVGRPIGSFIGQGSSTAFVGELDFMAAYTLTSHIAVRGGYQLLWLSDLALATDAASRSLTNPGLLTTVSDSDHLFYQRQTWPSNASGKTNSPSRFERHGRRRGRISPDHLAKSFRRAGFGGGENAA